MWSSLLSAIVVIVSSLSLQAWRRSYRRDRFKALELRPNCLLTRHPIAFLSGPRTLFRLFDPWNDVPLFLREHGYEVVEVACRARPRSAEEWTKVLDRLPEKYHVVADSSQARALELIALGRHGSVVSLTLVRNETRSELKARSSKVHASDLRPRLPMAIETFELPRPDAFAGLSRNTRDRFANAVSLVLLKAHNALRVRKLDAFVDPVETGALIGLGPTWPIESRFLDLAISLAERDATGSRESV